MKRSVTALLLAGVALTGCATPNTPWPDAKTEAECRYEHRKEENRIRNVTSTPANGGPWWAAPLANGLAKGVSSSQNDQQLAACMARVNPDTTGTTLPANTPSTYQPYAGCTARASVLHGGSSYCVN